ncbi:MAG: flagellar biosynthetic protein FliR [Lachnospiraceae bacterium]|nr:flagellar biosynthetic protein FliR [Lachnospiraceae bacterium]
MVNYSFSLSDLEYFLLILTRVSCFIFIAPFFSMKNTPSHVRIGLSFFVSMLLYEIITPMEGTVTYNSAAGYAAIVVKEAITGLLIGFAPTMCSAIVNLAGSIIDMETGLSMATLLDPNTNQQTSISGALYQYMLLLLMIVTGMYRFLLGALADTFVLIPVNGAVFRTDSLLQSMIQFPGEYVVIAFRIALPVFCVMLILNSVLGIMAKVSPQLNMFAVGIQLKVLVGLSAIFLSISMLPDAADFIFNEMKEMMTSFVGGMM